MTACPYCNAPAILHPSSAAFYRGRDYGPVWACAPCEAWVGCHKGTNNPLGTPANATTRRLKVRAHAGFDALWQAKMARDGLRKGHARALAYKWLAESLTIEPAKCHIGMMLDGDLQRVIALCEPYAQRIAPACAVAGATR